jgi:hypothetical protein
MPIVKEISALACASCLAFAALADNPRGDTSTAPSAAAGSNPRVGGVSRDLEQEFKAMDRNGDGFLSREELEQNASLKANFAEADKNRDGKLDMAEFQSLEATVSPDRSLGSIPATGATVSR